MSRWEFGVEAKKLKVTVSLGITQFRKGEDLEQLISRVDKALYGSQGAAGAISSSRAKDRLTAIRH